MILKYQGSFTKNQLDHYQTRHFKHYFETTELPGLRKKQPDISTEDIEHHKVTSCDLVKAKSRGPVQASIWSFVGMSIPCIL